MTNNKHGRSRNQKSGITNETSRKTARERNSAHKGLLKHQNRVRQPSRLAHKPEDSYSTAFKKAKLAHERTRKPSQIAFTNLKELVGRAFWQQYVSERKPVILKGQADSVCRTQELSNMKHLRQKLGNTMVSVEIQKGKEGFGKGNRECMPFSKFSHRLTGGDELVYLTTQPDRKGTLGPPPVLATPAKELKDYFDLRPDLMGHLIPQSVNLWMGSSKVGTSSGLHHDFHDNLYVLLKGCKTFRLWSPEHAASMHTHGKLQKVYPNGRIVYEGQGNIRPDGSTVGAEIGPEASQSSGERLDDDEEVLDSDAELEAALNMEIGSRKRPREDVALSKDDFDDFEDDSASDEDDDSMKEEPPSFSRIDLSLPPAEIAEQYPDFPGLQSCTSCRLNAGDMLYLPAGWFHEVTSSNQPLSRQDRLETQEKHSQGWHMALNYWFHPPDNLKVMADHGYKTDCPENGYLKPYVSDYWQSLYDR